MRQVPQWVALLIPLVLTAPGCTTLPDVQPFAASTAGLAAAAGSHYRDVAADVAKLKPAPLPGEKKSNKEFKTRKEQIKASQQIFKETEKNLNTLFAAMTTYSEKVANLVSAGKTGAEAARSVLDSVQGFTDLAGISTVPLSGAAEPITQGFVLIADEFTKMKSKESLEEAVAAAEPGVKLVAEQFEVIYGKAINQAAGSVRNTKRIEASIAAGPNIIGFNENVKRNYNAYYRVLNGFVTDFDPKAPASAWRGFCREGSNPCQAVSELQAVGLVEARMEAIRPIVASYEAQIKAIDATLEHREKTSKAVIKAVHAWAREHQKLQRSLKDGTSLSAFNLKSALVELNGLLGQRP